MVQRKVTNHRAVAHSQTTLERIRRVKAGRALTGAHKAFGAAYRLLDAERPSPTVTRSGFRDFVHPTELRFCTVRELARLQTFPDSHEFAGRRCDTYAKNRYVKQTQHEQVGNAVPPRLARYVARAIRKQLLQPETLSRSTQQQRRFLEVFPHLDSAFPEDRLGNFADPLDELVFIMLSRRSRSSVYQPVFADLKKRYRKWGRILTADSAELLRILKPLGLVSQRLRDLRLMLRVVEQDFGTVSLARLRKMTYSAAYNYLRSLPGVNDKSAKCVLFYALGHNTLPVDTHTLRVSTRIGLIPADTSLHRAPRLLDRVVPPSMRGRYHVLTVLLGRHYCRSESPNCGACPVRNDCLHSLSRSKSLLQPA